MKDIYGNQTVIDFESLVGAGLKPAPTTDGDLTHDEKQILSLLQRGRDNAVGVKYLSEATGLKDVEIRQEIRHLIMDHNALIASSVSNPAGFYIAETPEEVEQATKSLRHRGIMILMRAARLQRISLEDIFGQARMEFDLESPLPLRGSSDLP